MRIIVNKKVGLFLVFGLAAIMTFQQLKNADIKTLSIQKSALELNRQHSVSHAESTVTENKLIEEKKYEQDFQSELVKIKKTVWSKNFEELKARKILIEQLLKSHGFEGRTNLSGLSAQEEKEFAALTYEITIIEFRLYELTHASL